MEVTESVLNTNSDSAIGVVQSMRKRGVRVAIDDFGTGFWSLRYLREFPVDTLKIDQSLVRQINASGKDSAIVAAVINLARSLDLRIIAEGVETLEEFSFLRAEGCDMAQGYYFSRPLGPEKFARLLGAVRVARGGMGRRNDRGDGRGPRFVSADRRARYLTPSTSKRVESTRT